MHFVRRAALRAASSSPSTLVSKSRSINTASPFLRTKSQNIISASIFRRLASNEAESRNEEEVKSAIDSASEAADSAKSYASDVADSASSYASQGVDSVKNAASEIGSVAAAATGYSNRWGRDQTDSSRGSLRDTRRASPSDGFAPTDRVIAPSNGIYVGNLLFDVTAADLTREFEPYGTIKSSVVAADTRGLSKGFGYVEFETIDQATQAIEARHQTVLEGRRLVVNFMAKTKREPRDTPPTKTLFIGNLAFEMSDADLNKLFREIRNVIDVRVAIDRRTGQPRGFAHADFTDVDSATKALELLSGKEIYGRKLRVDYSAGTRGTRQA